MALTKVSFSMINGAPVNPLDFGASGTGTGNDTAALQAAIDACPVGGLVYGNGLTYRVTGVTIDKAITVEGVNLLLFQATPAGLVQDAFTIESDDVKLLNCGATIDEADLPDVDSSAGVYCVNYDNVIVDGGEWVGSVSRNYTAGNWRGVIYIEGGENCVVQNTITRDAFGEGLWIENSTNAFITNNQAYNAGGSEIVFYSDYGLMSNNTLVGNAVAGNSGAAVGGDYVTVSNNTILNASGWGIAHGEAASVGGLITGNFVKGYGNAGDSNISGILSQGANGLVVSNNYVAAPAFPANPNYGISFQNGPQIFTCQNNTVELTSSNGIYAYDSTGIQRATIIGNTINSAKGWSIYVGNANETIIQDNHCINDYTTGTFDYFVYLDYPTSGPDYIRIIDNVFQSSTVSYTACVYLANTLSSSTQYIQHGNYFDGWTTQPYSDNRSCNYDVRNDNYAVSPKSGLVTLTNGGTTTTVTTSQVTSKNVITLQLGNAAAASLNPVYRISAQTNGSFTITHTAGTAAAEQLLWTII